MQTINLTSAMKAAFAAIVLLLASGAAQAQQQVNLTASPASTALSDGSVVPMWGYSCGAAASGSTATCTASNPAVAAAQAAVAAGTATAAQTAMAANWSPVVITVPSGQGLTVNLTNNLNFANGNTIPTSLVIVGQLGGGLGTGATATASPDHGAVRAQTWPILTGATAPAPAQGARVQSFSTEVAAAGATLTSSQVASGSPLTWSNLQPGTYLIQSGTHPSIQVPMGLYGILVVTDAATGTAYGAVGSPTAVTYNADIALLFSEIDPVQNSAVSMAVNTLGFSETTPWSGQPGGCGNPTSGAAFGTCYPPTVNYTPLYYLINGRTFDTTNASASVYPVNPLSGATCTPVSPATTCTPPIAGNVLVRLVNAGLKMHVPSIVGATTGPTNVPGMTLMAEDGNVLPGLARLQNEVFMAAGKTYDVMIGVPAPGLTALPIFDRELSLSSNATGRDGGMLAYIGINGAGLPATIATGASPAVANADTYNALVAGMPLTISDPGNGVIANDVRVSGVRVLAPPAFGQLTLNVNGTFTYVPFGTISVATTGGSGYVTAPAVTVSGGGVSTANALASIDSTGAVNGVTLTPSTGYTSAPTITIAPPPPCTAPATCATATATATFTPGTSTSDTFTYCANGTVAVGVCSSGITATVNLGASQVLANDGGVVCPPSTFNSTIATYIAIKSPGVLSGCTDGANLPLTVDTSTVTAAGITVVADANGGFTATAPGAGTYSFSFKAKNSLGLQSAATTVTVVFPTPSGLSVTVLDGADHSTPITDYRWIIEEDRTFYIDPACTANPLPATCPTIATGITSPINYGTNFHTSSMPVVAAGCTGALSCEGGQTLQGTGVVCDVGNGACRTTGTQQTTLDPSQVVLDPSKRYYISILPGDAANPFIGGNASGPTNCANGPYVLDPQTGLPIQPLQLNSGCGHGMGGAPIAAACGPQSVSKAACSSTSTFANVTVLAVPTPLPTATLSVFVYQDDYPLNGEHGSGGGVDVLAPQEPGLDGFQVTIFDQAGQTGAATGQPTYDMSNQPLSNALAGTIDPVTGLDACPISPVASANGAANAIQTSLTSGSALFTFTKTNFPVGLKAGMPISDSAGAIPAGTKVLSVVTAGSTVTVTMSAVATATTADTISANLSTSTSLIVTCPKFESDGKTLSPMAGQVLVQNLYPGRYGIAALPGASRIALGEEWVQTNTLDGQKAHDSFMRVGEPGYFQEFGPAGFHVSIGFANPKLINDRRYNDSKSGMCDTGTQGGNLACGYEVTGRVTGARMSRTPDQRLYSSGGRESLAFTQCYVSLGDPDGAEIAFSKCDSDGYFDFKGIPAGNWKVTTFDQWNDQIIDGITQPVSVGCSGNLGGLCTTAGGATNTTTTCAGSKSTAAICDMGEIGVHQWQANLYTRTFIDTTGTGVSDDTGSGSTKLGLALAATNVRFRDGSVSDFNNTDLNGYANFNEIFPLFNWYTVETDSTRYKTTGVHVIYDAGGPADGSGKCDPTTSPCGSSSMAKGLANTFEKNPLPADLSVPGAVYCDNADCIGQTIANGPQASKSTSSTGRIDPPTWFGSYGWQGYIGQGNFLEFGVKPFAANETGPIHGHVVYSSTRPFDNPQLLTQLKWEPLVAKVTVNLYREGFAADGVTPTLKLVDTTKTTSWDDWVQGFRPDGKPNMNCPGQQGATDPFFYALTNQPQYLDWYNSQHNGGTLHTLPYASQYKCYDGEHTWNQLQPAPYDGLYSFPSVTGLDPTTGKPTGTNCTACTPNPDTTDPYRSGAPMLPPGKYVVEVVVPPGYELVKEEDKNILIGDNFIAPAAVQFPGLGSAVYILPDQAELSASYNALNPQNPTVNLGRNPNLPSHEGDTGSVETFWPCVGELRQVPDFISLFPQSKEVAPFAGAYRNLCDRKEVTLDPQSSALAKFYLFTSTHLSSHFQGIILDDFAAEFDPFSPQFGEKFAPSFLPVAVKDWTGNQINRVYTDQFGLYNGLNYSTWEVNPPNPTGYAPTMMVMCMNDAGQTTTPDPLYQPGYSQFCYQLPFMPGQTGYFDTPVVPVQAFASGSYNRPDCAYPDATPAIASVTGDVAGPWVSAPLKTLTINALGNLSVDWYGYTGPNTTTAPYNQQKITRHYGFGATPGTVTIGGINATVDPSNWSDTLITVTVPQGVPACAVQQQAAYGGSPASCGQLVVTTAAGKQSIDTVTVTIGGKTPTLLTTGQTIQSAIDAAAPGDMIIVPPGTYVEMLVMWKPIRLQGVGAASSVVDANAHPAGKLLNPWRQKIVCLFGLDANGRPDTSAGRACASLLNGATNSEPGTGGFVNFPNMVVDRVAMEATLGWDATLNGNLAEQLIEPSLLGAYEGAAITVVGKGVKFPTGTSMLDTFGASAATPAAFPTGTMLLSSGDCDVVTGSAPATTAYPSNFYCNPSSIDGLGIRDSSQGGGGIFVHAYAHNLQIANNRVHNNQGTMAGGMTIGVGEHTEVHLGGEATQVFPPSCETSNIVNQGLPFCLNKNLNVHHNAVVGNSALGDELFSSTPAGAGGVTINTGSDYYQFTNNWVCGNLSSGDGGGVSHIGYIKNGDIERNTILFNQTTNPSITTNGGGLLVMGAPDADPTTCGVSTDQDCKPAPGTVTPSDGTGPGLKVNANLILGNAADSGSGGGLRIQHVNGSDVLNNPNGQSACSADLASCNWNSVNVTNNIIVNNVAGWDGAGISLLDVLAANIVNNTIASNDATASSGTLFQSLFAPLASSGAPTTNVTCGATNGQSCPQVAGLVSVNNSPVLQANIDLLPAGTPFICPAGHGVAGGAHPSCYYNSIPLMFNDAIWQNRSFYIGVGGQGTGNQNQQNVVALYNAPVAPATVGTPAASQPKTGASTAQGGGVIVTGGTGACVPGSSYWELGFRGDTAATDHSASGFQPVNSVLSAASYGGTNNTAGNPAFTSQYCNGSRSPPELGTGGYAVPPGVNEFNAFPNPVFSLTPSGVVDEGNNWVNVRWGPLALTNPATNVVLGNYAPTIGSPAIDSGVASVNAGGTTVAAPASDFFGNPRPAGAGFDIGAVEFPELSLSPGSFDFGNQDVLTTSAAQVFTLSNPPGGQTVTGIAPFLTGANAAEYAMAYNCQPTLAPGAQCTISVTFRPNLLGPRTATLTVIDSEGTQTSSLTGTGTGPLYSLTPSALFFPNTVVNQASAAQTVTLRNNQPISLTTTALALTDAFSGLLGPEYRIVPGATTCTVNGVVASGATCVVSVTFNPKAFFGFGGSRPGNLSLTAAGLLTNVPLSGTAILFPVDVTPKGGFGINGQLMFATQTQVGQTSAALVATLSNYQNATAVTVNSITMPSQFQIVNGPSTTCTPGAVLGPAASDGTPTTCTVAIQFAPTATAPLLMQTGTFNLSGSPVNPAITLIAFNPNFPSPVAVNTAISGTTAFGNQTVGTTSGSHLFTYTNSGPTQVTVTGVTLTGTNRTNFAIASNLCTTPVAANGGTCTVGVTFTPSAAGSRTATLNVTDAIGTQTLGLTGTGLAPATTTPGTLTLANTPRGSVSATKLVTLSNPAGNPNMTGTSIAFGGTNATYFRRSTTTAGSCPTSATFTVAAGANCTIGIVFAPPSGGTTGAKSGTLTISTTSLVPPPTPAVGLSGTAQ